MSESNYIPGLHGLRALACLAVFAVHWHQRAGVAFRSNVLDVDRLLHNGNTGVALLFLLSGYLLSKPLWLAAESSAPVSQFVRHRVARIVPAYYACMTVILLLDVAKGDAPHWYNYLLHFTLTHNLDPHTFYALCPQFWTLAVQVQFYLLFGMLLWPWGRIRRLSAAALFATLLVLLAVSYAVHFSVMEVAQRSSPGGLSGSGALDTVLGRSVLAHCPIFLLGAALGYFDTLAKPRSTNLRQPGRLSWDLFALSSLVATILILGTSLDDRLQVPYGRYNFPFVPLLLGLVIVAIPRTCWSRQFLELWPLRWLGTVSYGFYVYHYSCMSVVERVLPAAGRSFSQYPWLAASLSFLLALVVASASFIIFERPIMRWIKPKSASLH